MQRRGRAVLSCAPMFSCLTHYLIMKRSRTPMALSRPEPGTRSVSSSPAADPSLPPRLHTQEPALNVPQVLQPACGNARTSSRRLRRSVSRGVVREGRPDLAAEKAARRASVAPTMRTPKSPRPTPSATSIKTCGSCAQGHEEASPARAWLNLLHLRALRGSTDARRPSRERVLRAEQV